MKNRKTINSTITDAESLVRVAKQFLLYPDELHYADELDVNLSIASVYRLLRILEDEDIIKKRKMSFFLNNEIVHNQSFLLNTLPYVGRQTANITSIYIVKTFLANPNIPYTIKEFGLFFRRDSFSLKLILNTLLKYDILNIETKPTGRKNKKITLYTLHKTIKESITRNHNTINMHKSKMDGNYGYTL